MLRAVIRLALPVALCASALAFASCGDDDEEQSATTTGATGGGECESVEQPPARNVDLKPPARERGGLPTVARVKTSCGDFEIDLDGKRSPKTVASFAQMAEEGVYDDTTFQRVVPDFVIQGGDPTGDGTGDAGYTVEEAPPPDAAYTRGIVAMAKTGAEPPGTSGSQFFVVTAADAGLPPDYAILGKLRSGQATIDAIEAQASPGAEAATDPAEQRPLQPVVIEQITVR
jgi:cyclophilin family peptidyl-prolyl cis-trans isomerase